MGEVYRARDTKLGRDVAIKVLPTSLTNDPDRLARFQREAQVLAALNHPSIAAIFHVEDARDAPALVMELVEGETLADRIARGPIPIDEALTIAKQIAEALETAHDQGIIHRDLKPANIKVTPNGQVKVLDFGLAKLAETGEASRADTAALSLSPTITSPAFMTSVGVLLGTAAYMSPEQARGQNADRRSDIFAFGSVLFEMLTGRRAFPGDTPSDVLAFVLARDVEWSLLPSSINPRILELLRRCLDRNPKNRWQAAGDLRAELAIVATQPTIAAIAAPFASATRRRERLAWMVAATAVLAAIALAVPATRALRTAPGTAPEMRLHLAIPQERAFGFALSPDGSTLAFENDNKLWVRPIDADAAQPVAGTDSMNGGSFFPFWSPDSKSIGFFADNKVRRVDLATSSVRTIADLPGWAGNGGTWNRDGVIVFGSSSDGTPLYRVSADGGASVAVTKLAADERTQRFPQFLPDGRRFIFFARTTTGHGLYLGSLDSLETKRLLDADGKAAIVPPDTVLFVRNGALLAQHFDLANMTPRGNPVPVAGKVAADLITRNTSLSADMALTASDAGTVMYQASTPTYQGVLVDQSGAEIGRFPEDINSQASVRPTSFSPDGRMLAMARSDAGNIDLWLFDVERKLPPRRFTSNPAFDGIGVWSPDGKQIVYASNRKGVFDLYVKSVDADDERPLLESTEGKVPDDWSSDGRYILYQDANPKTSDDMWALPLFGDRKPIPIAQTPSLECCGRFSPDGRWVSYDSWETGRRETYVQPFPGTTGRIRVSANGGGMSSWSANGREFFYGTNGGEMLSVTVNPDGQSLAFGQTRVLFRRFAAASPDGKRFLTSVPLAPESPITVLLNWKGR
jgi:Tol biopolymer transport system component